MYFKVKEWLCLNCQVKRATSGIEPEPEANSSLKKISPTQPTQQKTSATGSPQKNTSARAAQPGKVEAPTQKSPMESRKRSPQNQPGQASQTGLKHENAAGSTQQQSGGFFGFGASKIEDNASKPSESVTGKMFGFGSSIFSSASTLISSSTQDEPKTTPSASPKRSVAETSKSPIKKPDQEKKPDRSQQTKGSLPAQDKGDKPSSEQLQKASAKADQSVCPLCKLELNIGSKAPPNYNTCTVCHNIVCKQCGFNPMPNVTEVRK